MPKDKDDFNIKKRKARRPRRPKRPSPAPTFETRMAKLHDKKNTIKNCIDRINKDLHNRNDGLLKRLNEAEHDMLQQRRRIGEPNRKIYKCTQAGQEVKKISQRIEADKEHLARHNRNVATTNKEIRELINESKIAN